MLQIGEISVKIVQTEGMEALDKTRPDQLLFPGSQADAADTMDQLTNLSELCWP